MAITFVGAGSGVAGNNASLTPALPSGLQPGDLLILVWSSRSIVCSSNIPSGWALVLDALDMNATSNRLRVFTRYYASGMSAPTLTPIAGSTGVTIIAQIMAFRNAHPSAPILSGYVDYIGGAAQQDIGPARDLRSGGTDAAVVIIGHKADDCTSVATLSGDGLTWQRGIYRTSTLGNDATLVADFALISGPPQYVSPKTFSVTGGASATWLTGSLTFRSDYPESVARLSWQQSANSISSTATVQTGSGINASLVSTQASQAVSAAGSIRAAASLARTQASQTASAAAHALIAGHVSSVRSSDSPACSAAVRCSATLGAVQQSHMAVSTAAALVRSSAALAQVRQTCSSDASVRVSASVAASSAANTIVATIGVPPVQAWMTAGQAAQPISAAAAVAARGTVSASQAAQSMDAWTALRVAASVGRQQAPMVAASTAAAAVEAQTSVAQSSHLASAVASVRLAGTVAVAQDPAVLWSTATAPAPRSAGLTAAQTPEWVAAAATVLVTASASIWESHVVVATANLALSKGTIFRAAGRLSAVDAERGAATYTAGKGGLHHAADAQRSRFEAAVQHRLD